MKKITLVSFIFVTMISIISCKSKKKEEVKKQEIETLTTNTNIQPTDNNVKTETVAKTFTIIVAPGTPDTVSIGKKKAAFIKIIDLKAEEILDSEGKATGTTLSYKIVLTNKNPIGKDKVYFETSNFRLELDNGTKVSPKSVFIAAEPEATETSKDDFFTIPLGVKPTALILFYEDVKSTVKLQMN